MICECETGFEQGSVQRCCVQWYKCMHVAWLLLMDVSNERQHCFDLEQKKTWDIKHEMTAAAHAGIALPAKLDGV